MDIACMTDNDYLRNQVELALAPQRGRFTGYRSIASLARGLDQCAHDVILLAGDNDLIEKFVSCRLPAGNGARALVILLSDHDCGAAVDRALAAGIDDFVSISSGLSQLETRIRACARRRTRTAPRDVVSAGGVELDRRDGSARVRGVPVDLTQREFLLGWALFDSLSRVVTAQRLAETVWGTPVEVAKRSIEQHVYRLRGKLRINRGSALSLTTVYGRGYRLDETGAGHAAVDSPSYAPRGAWLAPDRAGPVHETWTTP
jgi:DNA-binding response OmpR family regulator